MIKITFTKAQVIALYDCLEREINHPPVRGGKYSEHIEAVFAKLDYKLALASQDKKHGCKL